MIFRHKRTVESILNCVKRSGLTTWTRPKKAELSPTDFKMLAREASVIAMQNNDDERARYTARDLYNTIIKKGFVDYNDTRISISEEVRDGQMVFV